MYCLDSNPTLVECVFEGNAASVTGGQGGGIYCESSTPHLHDCEFIDNEAPVGAGMSIVSALPVIEDCLFDGNAEESCCSLLEISVGSRRLFTHPSSGRGKSFGIGLVDRDEIAKDCSEHQ